MAQRFYAIDVDETEQLVGASGTMIRLHYAIVTNPGATIAYCKFWNGTLASVDPSTDLPDIAFGVPPGATITAYLGDVEFNGGCVIGATAAAGVDAAAPASDFVASVFFN